MAPRCQLRVFLADSGLHATQAPAKSSFSPTYIFVRGSFGNFIDKSLAIQNSIRQPSPFLSSTNNLPFVAATDQLQLTSFSPPRVNVPGKRAPDSSALSRLSKKSQELHVYIASPRLSQVVRMRQNTYQSVLV